MWRVEYYYDCRCTMYVISFCVKLNVQILRNNASRSICITVVNENVSLVISRQVLTDVSSRLLFLPDEISKAVSHYTLDKVDLYNNYS